MIVFPAIDIKDGRVVRLYKGSMDSAKSYSLSPLEQAMQFEEGGLTHLHIVDLDGAINGRRINAKIIDNIVSKTKLKVQIGGGIRTQDDVSLLLDIGVLRVIIGTMAITNPDLFSQIIINFPNKIVLGLDAIGDNVKISGWEKDSDANIFDVIKKYNHLPLSGIIYTDISRDGTLEGVNINNTVNLQKVSNIPVIASGGVRDAGCLEKLASEDIYGTIIGKAFYEGRISLSEMSIYEEKN